MRLASGFVVGALCSSLGWLGCSSSSSDAAPVTGPNDAGNYDGSTQGSDAGSTASDAGVTPAFKPEMPQIMSDGGTLLTAPEVVTITWTTDPNAKTFEAFGDAIGTSDYWKPLTEYGIGAAVSGSTRHVEISDAPKASMTEDELDTFVADHVAAAPGNGWPALTAQTVYMVYIPPTMKITSGGADDCESTSGYHDETTSGALTHIVYGVVLEACHDSDDVVSFSTATASHEIVEAATDPHTQTDLGWTGFDPDHLAWDIWQAQQDEVADACEYYPDANYQETAPFDYEVQQFWSNAKAAAGHNPCVKAPDLPYFNTTPLHVEPIAITHASTKSAIDNTKGFRIGVGATRTVQFGFYGDGDKGPWAFDVVEGDGFTAPETPHLSIVTDKTAGNNGDIANVTFIVNSVGAKTGILVTAISTRGDEPIHYMPVLIGAY